MSEERIEVWTRLWRAATTPEERDQIAELAKTSGEESEANAAFIRSTFTERA